MLLFENPVHFLHIGQWRVVSFQMENRGFREDAERGLELREQKMKLKENGATAQNPSATTPKNSAIPSTSCNPDVCQAARRKYAAPDLTDSPWHSNKTIFFLAIIALMVIWVIVYTTISQLKLVWRNGTTWSDGVVVVLAVQPQDADSWNVMNAQVLSSSVACSKPGHVSDMCCASTSCCASTVVAQTSTICVAQVLISRKRNAVKIRFVQLPLLPKRTLTTLHKH